MKVLSDQITQTVAPASEPVTTAEAKSHLRVDITDDDTLIASYVQAARLFCESYTGRSFVRRTYRADVPDFADQIVLPGRPIISITSIKYYNTDSPSVLTTLDSGVYALVHNCINRNYGETWESVYPRADAVEITYIAGYAPTSSPEVEAESVPEPIKTAIKMIVGDLYENREGKIVGTIQSDNPTVLMLLNPYRVYL
jgi:uncharacterized phiE125 gp8 family phage protein